MSKQAWKLSKQALFLMVANCAAFAGTLSPELTTLPADRNVDVIVRFTGGAGASAMPANGRKLADLPHGALYRMSAAEARSTSNHPAVENVSVNRTVFSTSTPVPVYDFMPQSIQPKSPLAAWPNLVQGAGVGVVLVDSGIHVNADLSLFSSAVVYSENFSSDSDTDDHYGHGTHVAGLIAGNGRNSLYGYPQDIHGVSPGVRLINLKVLDSQGMSTDAQVIQAIDRAITLKQLHPEWNIKVLNLSLGRPVYEVSSHDPLCREVEEAWLAGITVVVAAGNDGRLNAAGTHGYGTIASPGNDPLVITVGSINTESTPDRTDDLMTTYSSKGPTLVEHVVKPDLVAPGNKLFSVLAPGSLLSQDPLAIFCNRLPMAARITCL